MAAARDVRPRRIGGGRSGEYAARRRVRGTVGEYAAEWSDAASHSVFDGLHAGSARVGVAICKHTEGVLASGVGGIERFLTHDCHGACAFDRALAADILTFHAGRLARATS
ncbi:hypothetical protein AB1Y20_011102 [Prymnesium parvum]|uniref:Uncharacterized protein n=1 Tax=Prymnesium parvum TaxID=97485 RepID=A0AB34IPI2_PRYPA